MARKKIPYKDKAIVKKRLAQGQSLSKAIEGTSVKSKATAKKIGEEEANDIEQMRKDYLLLIEGFDASEIDRAKLWAKMTRANKLYGKDAVSHPDWKNRGEALKYIDSLRGIHTAPSIQVNVFGNAVKKADDFVEGEEVK